MHTRSTVYTEQPAVAASILDEIYPYELACSLSYATTTQVASAGIEGRRRGRYHRRRTRRACVLLSPLFCLAGVQPSPSVGLSFPVHTPRAPRTTQNASFLSVPSSFLSGLRSKKTPRLSVKLAVEPPSIVFPFVSEDGQTAGRLARSPKSEPNSRVARLSTAAPSAVRLAGIFPSAFLVPLSQIVCARSPVYSHSRQHPCI